MEANLTTTTTTGAQRAQGRLALRCWRSGDLSWTELNSELDRLGLTAAERSELDLELEEG